MLDKIKATHSVRKSPNHKKKSTPKLLIKKKQHEPVNLGYLS